MKCNNPLETRERAVERTIRKRLKQQTFSGSFVCMRTAGTCQGGGGRRGNHHKLHIERGTLARFQQRLTRHVTYSSIDKKLEGAPVSGDNNAAQHP